MNIENWRRIDSVGGMLDVEDSGPVTFQGRVYGHEEIPDGDIIKITMDGYSFREEAFIGSDGGDYRLKDPDVWYEQEFKDAKRRLNREIYRCRFILPIWRIAA